MSEQPTTTGPGLTGYGGGDDPTRNRPARRALTWNGGTDVGLLLLRFAVGGILFAHGAQKVLGIWGGTGIGAFSQVLAGHGYQQTVTLAWVTGFVELVAGAFVVLGLLTPLAAAALLAIMINAVLVKLNNGFFLTSAAGSDALEFDLLLGLASAALVVTGPGRIALDNGRAWHRRPAPWGVLALVIGIAAAVLVRILLREPALSAPA